MGAKAHSRHKLFGPPPSLSREELATRFIEECSLQPKSCPPCPAPILSPLALLGRPTLDREVLLARALKLAEAGLARVEYLRAEAVDLLGSPGQGLNDYHVFPMYEDGYGIGLGISPRRSRYIFERGMEPGDVLIGINGRPVLGNARMDGWRGTKSVAEVLRREDFIVVVLEDAGSGSDAGATQ